MDKKQKKTEIDPDKLAQLWNIGSDTSVDSKTQGFPNIQNYKIIKTLGEGGMGIIYFAEQLKPIQRQVALKVIKPGMDSRQVLARFETERQALALLDHPNIAHIYDAGLTEHGLPFFVMEYIDGMPITTYCDKHKLSIEERLGLFTHTCQAIHHAHQKGIIHRDIKPSNILVAIQDDKPIPKVIDFGIAKAISQHLTEQTIFTEQGQLIGTPEYMSPEQAELSNQDIDIRSDIYSLGILLYELLTGSLPFDTKTLRKAAFGEIQRVIREQEPPKPSTRLSNLGEDTKEIVQNRRTELPLLIKRLHKELEWIPLMAIRKEREHRYQSATELAEDINNYLTGNPLVAGPESAVYRFRKLVKKRKGLVVAVTAVLLSLSLGIIISVFFAFSQHRARKEADIAKAHAIQDRRATQRASKKLAVEKQRTDRLLYYQSIMLADQAVKANKIDKAKQILADCPEQFRHWEWGRLQYLCNLDVFTIDDVPGRNQSVAFSADSSKIAIGGMQNNIFIYDFNTEELLNKLTVSPVKWVFNFASSILFTPDNNLLVAGYNWRSKEYDNLLIWDANTGQKVKVLKGHKIGINSIALSSDGKTLASAGTDALWQNRVPKESSIKIWDINSGKSIGVLDDHSTTISFKPNSSLLVSGGNDGVVRVWDVNDLSIVRSFDAHDGPLRSIAISPDGSMTASAANDMMVRLWNLHTGQPIKTLTNDLDIVSIAFNPNGEQLIAGTSDGLIVIWETHAWSEQLRYQGHEDRVVSISFSENGDYFVSGGHNSKVKVWCSAVTGRHIALKGHSSSVTSISFSPDGKQFATAAGQPYDGFDPIGRLWDTSLLQNINTLVGQHRCNGISFSPDGRYIVTGCQKGHIKVWDRNKLQEVHELSIDEKLVVDINFTLDGNKLIVGSNNIIKIWDTKTWNEEISFVASSTNVDCMDVSSSGKLIASGGFDNLAHIWNADTGQNIFTLNGHNKAVRGIAFSPNDKYLATASWDKTVKIWDVKTGEEMRALKGHTWGTDCVQFHPDGSRLFSGSGEPYMRVWDIETGHELLKLDRQAEKPHDIFNIYAMEFAPDGLSLFTSGSAVEKDLIVWPSFPWKKTDYPGSPETSIDDRIKSYKREYWKQRLLSVPVDLKPEKASKNLDIDYKKTLFAKDSLISWWKFDDGEGTIAHDSVGNNHGIFVGNPTWTTGKVGGALKFDGINDSVMIPDFGNIAPTSEITIAVWVNLGVLRNQDLFSFDPLEPRYGDRISIHFPWGGDIHWQFGQPFQGTGIPLPSEIFGIWEHYTFVASSSGNFMKIYRNGVEAASAARMNDFVHASADAHIGGGRTNSKFKGSIDDVRIYNYALSAEEISKLYKGEPNE